jgi:hypothetical protein
LKRFGDHCFCWANIGTLGIDPELELGLTREVLFRECSVMSIENLPQFWRFAGNYVFVLHCTNGMIRNCGRICIFDWSRKHKKYQHEDAEYIQCGHKIGREDEIGGPVNERVAMLLSEIFQTNKQMNRELGKELTSVYGSSFPTI